MVVDGDHSDVDRLVQHQISFKNKDDIAKFRNILVNKGYVVAIEDKVIVKHICCMQYEKMLIHVKNIMDAANSSNGSYEGWKADIIK